MFLRKLKLNSQGFTLTELMVVVAIIGLLSAVAIPQFQKYQARTKTVEAKIQLSAIYTAEAAFFADYTMYATCLNFMGYNPTEEINNRFYATGFFSNIPNVDATAAQTAIINGLDPVGCVITAISPQTGSSFFPAGRALGNAVITSPTGVALTTSFGTQADFANMTYTAGAAGYIYKGYTTPTTCSAFTIDEKKVIKIIRNGF